MLMLTENRLNTQLSLKSLRRLTSVSIALPGSVIHLCLLCSPTFWTVNCLIRSGCSSTCSSSFPFSPWALTPAAPLSLCFQGMRLPTAPAITQNRCSIITFDSFQMCHGLVSHFIPSIASVSLFSFPWSHFMHLDYFVSLTISTPRTFSSLVSLMSIVFHLPLSSHYHISHFE